MTEKIIQTAGGVRAHLLAATTDAQLALVALDERRPADARRNVARCAATLEAIAHTALPAEVLEAQPLRRDDTLVVRVADLTVEQMEQLARRLRAAFPGRQIAVIIGEHAEIQIGARA